MSISRLQKDKVLTSLSLAGRVKRYHTWPTIHTQSTGEHSARVATLYCEIFGIPRAEVLYFCLHHDSGEFFGGDIPFGAKRKYPSLKEASNQAEAEGRSKLGVELPLLTAEEYQRFKLCDITEMQLFANIEMLMGNRFGEPVAQSCESAIAWLLIDASLDDQNAYLSWVSECRNSGILIF